MKRNLKPKKKRDAPAAARESGVPREAIDAALAIVEQRGMEALTMRAVGERIGVTHVALYRHFASKHALLAAIAVEGFGLLRERLVEVLARAPDGISAFEGTGRVYFEFSRSHRGHFRVMYSRELAVRRAHPSLAEASRSALLLVLESIARGHRDGTIVRTHPVGLAIAGWSMVHGLASLVSEGQLEDAGIKIEDALDTVLALLRGGFIPRND